VKGTDNNDGQTVFPEVLLESGTPDFPVSLTDCHVVAEDVVGETLDWSEVEFDDPVRCASGGLYVLFKFPVEMEFMDRGAGGGPAIGYCLSDGCAGWISPDGQDWVKVDEGYGFAVVPQYTIAEGWMLEMNGNPAGEGEIEAGAETIAQGLGTPAPNPFNPSVELSFGIEQPASVEISIFDVRGRRVAQLLDGPLDRGNHSVTWFGTDDRGRRLGSGVYFARLKTGNSQQVRKLMLVK